MELFRNINIDWMSKKIIYAGISGVLLIGSLVLIITRGIPWGVDFKGGTIVTVKFAEVPQVEEIRSAVDKAGIKDARIQRFGDVANNEYLIATEQTAGGEEALDKAKQQIISALQQSRYAGKFEVRNPEIVGPQAGSQLKWQAFWATIYSFIGMLVYLAFRFEWVYGAAAVAAVIHDTVITFGVFTLTGTDISLTVVAALLTLVGYSMNDTIVIFDRIRENLKLSRRESLYEIVNKSINQTLGRTILTSGLTFLTVLALFIFGGPVIHGFSFALVIGILIGTYSTIAVAAPLLLAYQDYRSGQRTPAK